MNKIYNINLGGYPFTIDDDAYEVLNKYLKTIANHFSKSDGCEDIISDIESRIAELFNEHMQGQPIVSMRQVDKMISIMGTPEEFGATPEADEVHDRRDHKTKSQSSFKTGKRLFRDPDASIIGGVCSGISSYFGIEDPVWIRIAFAIAFFTGFGMIGYIILWIALPEAKSAADKLSMKGEKINVSNIARIVEDEFNNLGDTIAEITKDFGTKKKV